MRVMRHCPGGSTGSVFARERKVPGGRVRAECCGAAAWVAAGCPVPPPARTVPSVSVPAAAGKHRNALPARCCPLAGQLRQRSHCRKGCRMSQSSRNRQHTRRPAAAGTPPRRGAQ